MMINLVLYQVVIWSRTVTILWQKIVHPICSICVHLFIFLLFSCSFDSKQFKPQRTNGEAYDAATISQFSVFSRQPFVSPWFSHAKHVPPTPSTATVLQPDERVYMATSFAKQVICSTATRVYATPCSSPPPWVRYLSHCQPCIELQSKDPLQGAARRIVP